jgi:Flp pilus assembly pilin Flp
MAPIAGALCRRLNLGGLGAQRNNGPLRAGAQAKGAPARAAPANLVRGARCGLGLMFQRLWRDQRGRASLIYHLILIALITVLVVVGVAFGGSWVQRMWARLLLLLG